MEHNPLPLVRHDAGRVLLDRQSLARILGRSVHTIRARCPVAKRDGIRPLYDAHQCAQILASTPTRHRGVVLTPAGDHD